MNNQSIDIFQNEEFAEVQTATASTPSIQTSSTEDNEVATTNQNVPSDMHEPEKPFRTKITVIKTKD